MISRDEFAEFTRDLDLRPPVPREKILQVGKTIGFEFPDEYVDFMTESNGANGSIRLRGAPHHSQLILYPIEVVAERAALPEAEEMYPGLVMFGTDGGQEAYFFERTTRAVIERPFIGSDDDARHVGHNILEFLRYLSRGGPAEYPNSLVQ